MQLSSVCPCPVDFSNRRYAFRQQPSIGQWNLCRLAESLIAGGLFSKVCRLWRQPCSMVCRAALQHLCAHPCAHPVICPGSAEVSALAVLLCPIVEKCAARIGCFLRVIEEERVQRVC